MAPRFNTCGEEGQVIVGLVTSFGVTVNEQLLELLEASVTVKVTVTGLVPETNVPAAGLCVTTSALVAVQLSLTVAEPV